MSQKIPHVKGPQWWQFIHWILDPLGYLKKCRRASPDLFAADIAGLGGKPIIFVNEPSLIQYVLSHDRKELSSPGDAINVLKPLIGNASIVMLEREKHRNRRKLLMPCFHGERLTIYGDLITQITLEEIDQLPLNRPFKTHRLTQQISLQVIMQAVFGLKKDIKYQKTQQLLTYLFNLFNSPFASSFLFFNFLQKNWGLWKKFVRKRAELDALIYEEIAARAQKSGEPRQDILSLLMASKDETGQSMSPPELRDELMTLLLAGLETTSTVMAWVVYWVHRYPEIKQKILLELASLGPQPLPSDIARLPYLTAVCQETLRIHPPVIFTFARLVPQDMEIGGYSFPKDSRVTGCIHLLHQREDLYPNPTEFRPERFLERTFTPYEFMPFGGGARRCIGESLALFEIKVAVATMLFHYDFALTDDRSELPRRRGVILAPQRGVPLKILRRRIPGHPPCNPQDAAAI